MLKGIRGLIKSSVLAALVIGFLGLNACCREPRPSVILVPTAQYYVDQLRSQGVQVIQTGETIIIVVPSDQIFYPDSANFSPDSALILKPLNRLLGFYETTVLRISGYTDNMGSPLRNRALSEEQAQRVARYLGKRKVDARLIYPVGYGAARPIADNTMASGRAQNRRVEIRFRYVVIPPL